MTKISLRADRIRAMRERLGWSQRELAEKSGMGLQQIHRYESGKADATATGLKAIAAPLGVTADYLIGLSDDPTGYAVMQLSDEAHQLVEAFEAGDSATMLRIIAERMQK